MDDICASQGSPGGQTGVAGGSQPKSYFPVTLKWPSVGLPERWRQHICLQTNGSISAVWHHHSSRLGCWVGRKAEWNRTVHILWNDGLQFRHYLCRNTFCWAKLPLLRVLQWPQSQCSLDLLLGFANHKIKSVIDSNLLAKFINIINCIIWWVDGGFI